MADRGAAPSRALAYTGAGFSFAAIVGVLAYGGHRLDLWLGTSPWLLVAGAMTGVACAIWDLLRTVNALEEGRGSKKPSR